MKKYDAKKIFHYVSVHKADLEKIDVGIAEDWLQTNQRVYADGRLLIDIPRGENDLYLRQVRGSTWGTPVMRVVYKDGTVNVLNCYKTDKKEMPPTQVAKIVAEYKNRGVKMMGWDGVLR